MNKKCFFIVFDGCRTGHYCAISGHGARCLKRNEAAANIYGGGDKSRVGIGISPSDWEVSRKFRKKFFGCSDFL